MEKTTLKMGEEEKEAIREVIRTKVREQLDKGFKRRYARDNDRLCWKINDLCEHVLLTSFGIGHYGYDKRIYGYDKRILVDLGMYDAFKMCLEHGIVPEDIDLRFGIVNGYIKIAELMLDYGVPCDGLVMEVAAKNFHPESIKLLRDYGATLDRFPSNKILRDELSTRKRIKMEDYNKTLEMREYIPINPRRVLVVGN